jgi:hypothetical protein
MNETQKFEIEGLKELVDSLKDLPVQLQAKIIKTTLTKAENKFIVATLRNALPYSARLKETLRTVGDPKDKLAVYGGVTLGPRIDNKLPAGVLIRFIDRGTKERKTKKGYYRGQITARNAVAPIIENEIQPIIDWVNTEMGNETIKNLERRIKKVNKINNA